MMCLCRLLIGFNMRSCLVPPIRLIGENAPQRSVGCSIKSKDVLRRHKQRERCSERSWMAQASTVSVQTRRCRRLLFNCFPFFKISLPLRCEPRLSLPRLSFLSENRTRFKSLPIANLSVILKNTSAAPAWRPQISWLQVCRLTFQLAPLNCSTFSFDDDDFQVVSLTRRHRSDATAL